MNTSLNSNPFFKERLFSIKSTTFFFTFKTRDKNFFITRDKNLESKY